MQASLQTNDSKAARLKRPSHSCSKLKKENAFKLLTSTHVRPVVAKLGWAVLSHDRRDLGLTKESGFMFPAQRFAAALAQCTDCLLLSLNGRLVFIRPWGRHLGSLWSCRRRHWPINCDNQPHCRGNALFSKTAISRHSWYRFALLCSYCALSRLLGIGTSLGNDLNQAGLGHLAGALEGASQLTYLNLQSKSDSF